MNNSITHVFVDTETTGIGFASKDNPRPDGIIEFGMAYRDGNEIKKYGWLAKPDKELYEGDRAKEALSVSKISYATINQSPPDYIVCKFVRDTINLLPNPILHSYNIDFDKLFLEAPPWNFTYQWGDDPMKMAKQILHEENWLSLANAMKGLHIPNEGVWHRAVYDAECALKVYEECLKRNNKEVE